MSKRQQLCLIGIFIPLFYLSGVPSFWKGIVFALVGLYLIAFAYRVRIESITVSHEEVVHVASGASAQTMDTDTQAQSQVVRPDGTA